MDAPRVPSLPAEAILLRGVCVYRAHRVRAERQRCQHVAPSPRWLSQP